MKLEKVETSPECNFSTIQVERGEKMQSVAQIVNDKKDHRMRAWNPFTQRREDVILFPLPKIAKLAGSEDPSANSNLRLDIEKALSAFSPLEQRIIKKVLIQGYTVRSATSRMKHTTRSWEGRLYRDILPKLREALGDYYHNGKIILD